MVHLYRGTCRFERIALRNALRIVGGLGWCKYENTGSYRCSKTTVLLDGLRHSALKMLGGGGGCCISNDDAGGYTPE